jgi:hypothetical protein
VLAAVLIMATAGTVMLREGLSGGSFSEIVIGHRAAHRQEVVLAWIFTISYTERSDGGHRMALAFTTLMLWPVDTEDRMH